MLLSSKYWRILDIFKKNEHNFVSSFGTLKMLKYQPTNQSSIYLIEKFISHIISSVSRWLTDQDQASRTHKITILFFFFFKAQITNVSIYLKVHHFFKKEKDKSSQRIKITHN